MPILHFLRWVALGGGLLLSAPGSSHTPARLAADSAWRPASLVVKAGLRLTHLHYAHDSQSWQFLVPLSLGAEYRLAPAYSIYGLVEVDMLASHLPTRRRTAKAAGTVPAAALSFGLRHYYGQSRLAVPPAAPEFGKYLALDGSADWQQLTTNTSRRQRQVPATLTPALYVLWGIQNRLRPHMLYDLNAGLGLLAPAHYYHLERASGTAHWNAGAQVNIRLYFGY